jgi:hypothetical protein
MPALRQTVVSAVAFCGYILTALVFHWPLPAGLSGALPGPVSGDTGVYV